ncbi:MAG: ATP-binding cassette domain-containing protein [Bacilli bacterium]
MSDFSYYFPSCGLVAIKGKSGSGKSTLLNLLSLLDSPTSGEIYFSHINLNKLSNKKRNEFIRNNFSFVFQSYHLINHLSVIDNVIVNLLIRNVSYKKASKKAEGILLKVGIDKSLFNKKVSLCSGGEKQRIAIARALITNPKIIFFDEPTGALDENNSLNVMKLISSLKKNCLCILVSHDERLIEKFADEIIELEYGKIKKITKRNIIKPITDLKNNNYKNSKKLSSFLYKKNINKRKKKHLFLSFSFSLALSFFIVIFSFSVNKDSLSKKEASKQLDYPSLTLVKEKIISTTSSSLKLVKTMRPSNDDVLTFKIKTNDKYIVDYNLDYLFYSSSLDIGENNFSDYSFSPIYSFLDEFCNKELLIKGQFPKEDNFNEIVINESLYKCLINEYNFSPLDLSFDISINTILPLTLSFDSEDIKYIEDVFIYEGQLKIVGVVKDFSFLSNKKIYYSYCGFKNILFDHLLNNLSFEMDYSVNVYDYFSFLNDKNYETSYSYRLFLKDYRNINYIKDDISKIDGEIKLISYPYEKETTFSTLLNVSNIGLNVFLVIAFLSLILLMIISYYSFILKDRKEIAIYLSLGALYKTIENCYVNEAIFISFVSFILSFVFSFIEQLIINSVIYKFLNISSFLSIPFSTLYNIPFLLPLFVLSITVLTALISIYIPLFLRRKISLSKELKTND